MHATEFVNNLPDKFPGVITLVGTESSLKNSVIQKVSQSILGNADAPVRFDGNKAELKTVRDELLTISMWTPQKVVVVDDASDFVSKNRPALEKYSDSPAKKSVLLLDVKTMPKNTKLYKIVNQSGLVIECTELKGAALVKYVQSVAKNNHSKKLPQDATQLLIELVGNHLGMLEQEVDKLATYVGASDTIDAEAVRRLVGGWKAETTWAMTDAVRDGDVGQALACLDKLLNGGESAFRILGGISFVFRKLATATELARTGVNLAAALKSSGVFPYEVDACGRYLRRIGRPRAEKISRLLLDADANLKGGSRLTERNQIELLLVQLAGKA